jgi:hypothetical protein
MESFNTRVDTVSHMITFNDSVDPFAVHSPSVTFLATSAEKAYLQVMAEASFLPTPSSILLHVIIFEGGKLLGVIRCPYHQLCHKLSIALHSSKVFPRVRGIPLWGVRCSVPTSPGLLGEDPGPLFTSFAVTYSERGGVTAHAESYSFGSHTQQRYHPLPVSDVVTSLVIVNSSGFATSIAQANFENNISVWLPEEGRRLLKRLSLRTIPPYAVEEYCLDTPELWQGNADGQDREHSLGCEDQLRTNGSVVTQRTYSQEVAVLYLMYRCRKSKQILLRQRL